MRPRTSGASGREVSPTPPNKIAELINRLAATDDGRDFLAFLALRCGQFSTSLSRTPDGEIATLSTEARESQRLIWIELRRLLPVDMRHAVEQRAEYFAEPPKPADTNAGREHGT